MKRTVYNKSEGLFMEKEKYEPLYMQNLDLTLTRGFGKSYNEFTENGNQKRQRLGSESDQRLSVNILPSTQESECGDVLASTLNPKMSSNPLQKSKISRFFKSKRSKKSRNFAGNFLTELLYSRGEKKEAEKRKMAKRMEYLNYLKTCSMFNKALLFVAYRAFKKYRRSQGIYLRGFTPVMIFKDNKVQKYYEKLDIEDLDISMDSRGSKASQLQILSNMGRNKAFRIEKKILTGMMLSCDSSKADSQRMLRQQRRRPLSRNEDSLRFLPQINGSGSQARPSFLGGTIDLSASDSLKSLMNGSPKNSPQIVSSFKVIASRNKILRSTSKKKRYCDFLKPSADSQKSKDPATLKERSRKIHKLFRRKKNKHMIENKIFDRRLLMATPTPVDKGELSSGIIIVEDLQADKTIEKSQEQGRGFYSFLGKDKSTLEAEKEERLRNMKKRKYDASTALMASLGHRIERYGKKILISCKGVSSSKR